MEPDAAPAGGRRNAPPKHSGGAGAPPGGQYEPPARSWLTASTAGSLSQAPGVRRLLTRGRPHGRKGPAGLRREHEKRGPVPDVRLRLWAKRTKTTANEPGHFNDVRAARREALPHLRKEMRILNRRRQRPSARHPLASGGARRRRRTRRRKETGRRSLAQSTYRGCLKSESD
jgi:hypothetical protein